MTEFEAKLIGEGGFGCVYDPSLKCKVDLSKGFNYNDYVSKYLEKEDAIVEKNNNDYIHKIDVNNKYHVGESYICEPEIENQKEILSECKMLKGKDNVLLLQKYGGLDLNNFLYNIKSILKYYRNKREEIDYFLLGFHNLLCGLKKFKANDLIHYDLKPHNILYNVITHKMVFIDFGLSEKKSEILSGEKGYHSYNFNLPLDVIFTRKKNYEAYMEVLKNRGKECEVGEESEDLSFSEVLISYFLKLKNVNFLKWFGKNDSADWYDYLFETGTDTVGRFEYLFEYLGEKESNLDIYLKLSDFFADFDKFLMNNSFEKVNSLIHDFVDIFGLGITMKCSFNKLYKGGYLDLNNYVNLLKYSDKLCEMKISRRELDLSKLLSEYENLMEELGILSRLRLKIVNNEIIKESSPVSKVLKEVLKKDGVSNGKSSSSSKSVKSFKLLKEFLKSKSLKRVTRNMKEDINVNSVMNDVSMNGSLMNGSLMNGVNDVKVLKCLKEGKDYNVLTKRCVKKCKEGERRSKRTQKCVKVLM